MVHTHELLTLSERKVTLMKLVAVGFARLEVRPTLCAASSLGLGLFGLPGKCTNLKTILIKLKLFLSFKNCALTQLHLIDLNLPKLFCT